MENFSSEVFMFGRNGIPKQSETFPTVIIMKVEIMMHTNVVFKLNIYVKLYVYHGRKSVTTPISIRVETNSKRATNEHINNKYMQWGIQGQRIDVGGSVTRPTKS